MNALQQLKQLDTELDNIGKTAPIELGNAIERLHHIDKVLDKTNLGFRLFERLFYSSPIGIAVIDNQQRFKMANAIFCETVGYSEDELKGLTWLDITHDDDTRLDLSLAEKTQAGQYTAYRMSKRYICKDGSTVKLLLFVTSFMHPVDGQVCYLSHIIPEKLLGKFAVQFEDIAKVEH